MHQLHDFEGWAGAWIEKLTIDWKRLRSHGLVIDYLCPFCAKRHHSSVEKSTRIHETGAENRQWSTNSRVLHHDFSIFQTVLRRNTWPVNSNVLDALTDVRSTRKENVILDRRHDTETKRTDHFNLRIEISCFVKESA